MGRTKKKRRRAAEAQARLGDAPPNPLDQTTAVIPGFRRHFKAAALTAAAAVVALGTAAGVWWWRSDHRSSTSAAGTSAPTRAAASYVGQQVCGECHQQVQQRWKGSHHDLAMQQPTEATVA